MSNNTGGPAFPVSLTNEQEVKWDSAGLGCANGMSLRDYFAAKAMQALIDNDALFSAIPQQAYVLADQMLKAREQ
jgi:nicotinamide riboside kinase